MILVTGATGFIGKNFILEYIKKSQIKILARPSSNIDFYRNIPLVQISYGDFVTGNGLENALDGVETVIHCAGLTMSKNFHEFYCANTLSTANLIQAMKKTGVQKILFLSSQSAGGPSSSKNGVDVNVLSKPVSFYGLSKKMAEDVIINSGLRHIILRPCAVYGPYETEILKFIKLLKKGLCITVGNFQKYLNLIYIKDLVMLMQMVIEKDFFHNKIYYISDGNCYSFNYIVKIIQGCLRKERCIRIKVPESIAFMFGILNDILFPRQMRLIGYDKVKEMSKDYWVCSSSDICRDIGWSPRYELKAGMEETVRWYEENGYLGS